MAALSHSKKPKLVDLKTIRDFQIPESFEYPHFYRPAPVAQEAARDLQKRLKLELPELENLSKGRMLGVLVVQTKEGAFGYLSAYSGELQAELEIMPFVPPVYQLPKGENFPKMAQINSIGKEVHTLESSEGYISAKIELQQILKETEVNILEAKKKAKIAKEKRDELRIEAAGLPENERRNQLDQLNLEGAHHGMDLRRYIRSENLKLEKAKEVVREIEKHINALKVLRREKSAELQEVIFQSFVFMNKLGERKNAMEVFNDFGVEVPPAGAGECAAPKLFQYAFKHSMTPIALAEFWWGASPNSEIREHGKFYPACKRKCQPILDHMLKGMQVKPNPLLENFGEGKDLEVLFEDEHLVVVNKPSGMLSVSGRYIKDSVQTRVQQRYPKATGPMIVHRLDQDTSGVMVVALNKVSHKRLQQQFLERSIQKTYMAILEKPIHKSKGVIKLPLILDINNRPMQMVSYKHGKPALTHYEVMEESALRTLIRLKPITGRSHQLRVHCAHKLGLHAPIVGDNLYGTPEKRLCLHAQQIKFSHPITGQTLHIKTDLPFSL
ncbi:RluA family pseudouridine synthase [Cytophaga sp. FL35]|uniref:RluA family pseudouridine synthase n=1 Tax=Cytophaga sp. FL35 TaxID=1904456 RepID=UPI001653E526|nr:RluA family pseudouridine synthase [Cytophaga sp. FL35]MBC6999280.1 RluA family pseudouridine synthase [Cytophaga sp. FL35]